MKSVLPMTAAGGATGSPGPATDDEVATLTLLENLERSHGFVPRDVSDKLSREIGLKMERLRRIQSKLETSIRRDVRAQVDHWRHEEGNLIMILHAIQNQHGYVPREVAIELSRELGVKLARIYEVITFYHYFKLTPPGAHHLTVCNGTACYLKGAADLLHTARTRLGIAEGQTTADRQYHLDVVRCIGCCGMAPAVVLDGKTHCRVGPGELNAILDAVPKTEAKP
jgi:NADH-quinone oxidoreductase subunit E